MNKKFIIPIVLGALIVIFLLFQLFGGSGKINVEWDKVESSAKTPDSIELCVYVENSGSMDGYMCSGSGLKDAVFDYVSDLKKSAVKTSLFYINSQVIPYNGTLDNYIKDLTPASFARAGGNRSNTDLRAILKMVLERQKKNTVSVFVSDCILDIPENAVDFFGNCQISVKNAFNEALSRNKELGVVIMQLESKFDGTWFCGKEKEQLSGVKRPYYIWVIGHQRALAQMSRQVPPADIIGGVKDICAFAPAQPLPYTMEKNRFAVNHTGKINIEVLLQFAPSLQPEKVIANPDNYKADNPLVKVARVEKIENPGSAYSHVVCLEVDHPETVKSVATAFNPPSMPTWIEAANDDTGKNVKQHLAQTTGIKYLVKGVAEAYKGAFPYGTFNLYLKNK